MAELTKNGRFVVAFTNWRFKPKGKASRRLFHEISDLKGRTKAQFGVGEMGRAYPVVLPSKAVGFEGKVILHFVFPNHNHPLQSSDYVADENLVQQLVERGTRETLEAVNRLRLQ